MVEALRMHQLPWNTIGFAARPYFSRSLSMSLAVELLVYVLPGTCRGVEGFDKLKRKATIHQYNQYKQQPLLNNQTVRSVFQGPWRKKARRCRRLIL